MNTYEKIEALKGLIEYLKQQKLENPDLAAVYEAHIKAIERYIAKRLN